MVKAQEYWKLFEQTGDIRDYLNYTACTSEREHVLKHLEESCVEVQKRERETEHDRFYQCDRDSVIHNTNW